MSQSAASQPQPAAYSPRAAHDHAIRPPARKVAPHAHGANRQATPAGYTFAHAGRQVRLGPVAFWIAVGTVVVMASWSVTTATYFAFRDDVLKGLMARQAEQQYGYEDRIAELRAQIDRSTSRQLLDQEQLEQKLDDLLHRQTTLESHAAALGGIADPAATGSVRSSGRGNEPASAVRPSAISDPYFAPQRLDRGTMLEPDRAPGAGKNRKQAGIQDKLGRIEASLDRVEHRESSALGQMAERYEAKARKLRSVFATLGVKVDAAPGAAMGGPFVPVKMPPQSQSFERALTQVSIARAYADRLSASLVTVPVRKPVTGEIDKTSLFGVRIDPFLHVAAMHTGIDFRGTMGEPIHATAAGTVTIAGWSGGYGNMVEINHGNGLATRYGHLSAIGVKVGQTVRIGEVIGRLGSTGRSTGPHVHYETRVDGEAVNPQKFLDAGAALFGGQS